MDFDMKVQIYLHRDDATESLRIPSIYGSSSHTKKTTK